jgi:small basic protein
MLWAITGILIGIIVGLNIHYSIPVEYIKYSAVIIVGVLDSLLGGIKAEVNENEYDPTLFITGLLTNIFLALLITFLGEKMGLDLYLAATVVFTFRIMTNISVIRRTLLKKLKNKK